MCCSDASTIFSLNMPSSINFTDLCQKMELLKELNTEFEEHNEAERQRYHALRREVSRKLLPLFADLEETEMLSYALFNRTTAATNMKRSLDSFEEFRDAATTGDLGDPCENGGIQLSLKN